MSATTKTLRELPARFAPLVGTTGFRCIRLHGYARDSHAPLVAVYLGNGANAAFLREYFFAWIEDKILIGDGAASCIGRAQRQAWQAADLQLSDVPPLWSRLPPGTADVRIPAWVSQKLNLGAMQDIHRWPLPARTAREAERQIRQHDYSLALTRNPNEIEDFFHQFYEPYIRARFGPDGVVVSRSTFLNRSRGQTLAQLRQGGKPVAGMMLFGSGRTLRLGWFGAAQVPPPPGASEALDALVIRHAWLNGVRHLSFGNTRPCLSDGVFRYKARFGTAAVRTRFPQAALGIAAPHGHPAVMHALATQPLIRPLHHHMGVYRVGAGSGGRAQLRLERYAQHA